MKKSAIKILAAAATLLPTASAADAAPVEVQPLGPNNALVRIDSDARYLLMPVQESVDDDAVNILVDGNLAATIYVRLAKTRIDYSVPLDLTPYTGHDIVLNVVTAQSRSTQREIADDACWRGMSVSDTFSVANREKYRPAYHHTPLYGWMNDPNGMVYKDGHWNLYYQWNPYGSKWQNMTWGHSSSSDLIHWNHHEAAIRPNGLGAVFSGSCAVDTDNASGFGAGNIVAMYTSAATSQVQSLAHSTDAGMTFDIYPGNPVIALDSEARDPNFFFNRATGKWNLALAHALEHEMLIFESENLKDWTLCSAFGKGLGAQGGVWECPDLFELPVEGSKKTKWVMICNLNPGGTFGGSAAQYFVGDFDGKTFTADRDKDGNVPTKWMDFGKDHYATVSWSDAPAGRRTVIGWMSNWQYANDVPTLQFRSANTLPRDLSLFKATDGQLYLKTLPAPETAALRTAPSLRVNDTAIEGETKKFALPTQNSGICEILLDIDPATASQNVEMELSNPLGDKVTMVYNVKAHTVSLDRSHSGIVDFSNDFPATTVAPTFSRDKRLKLRIFIDRSSIEMFEADGRFVMTNLVFPREPYTTLSLKSDARTRLRLLDIYPLTPTVDL